MSCTLQALSIVAGLHRPALSELLAGSLFNEPAEDLRSTQSPHHWFDHVLPALLSFLQEHLRVAMEVSQGLASLPPGAKVRQHRLG